MAGAVTGLAPNVAMPAGTAGSVLRTAAAAPVVRLSGTLFAIYMLVHVIEYGALYVYIPPLKVVRFSTLLSYFLLLKVLMTYRGEIMASRQAKLFVTFVVFTAAGILWAIVRSYVPLSVRYHFDYFGLFVVTAHLVDSRERATTFCITFVAIMVSLVAANVDKLGMDVRFGAFAAPYFMGDGNDFGWGLMVMLPFSMYLMVGNRRILTRLYGLGGFLVGIVGVIGTESRGASLALIAAMLLYWATVAKRKLVFVAILAVMGTGVTLFAPPAYFTRMKSLQNYEEDSSAQGRLRAWRAARQMALDYPLGVGSNNFNSAFGRFYMPADPQGYAAFRWISTHSCYFKVLAEYGYPGFILFLTILFSTFRDNFLSAIRLRRAEGAAVFEPEWPLIVNVSLIGYCICAMFLGGIAYPHLYMIAGLAVAVIRMSKQQVAAAGPEQAADEPRRTAVSPAAVRTTPGVLAPAVSRRLPDWPVRPGRFF